MSYLATYIKILMTRFLTVTQYFKAIMLIFEIVLSSVYYLYEPVQFFCILGQVVDLHMNPHDPWTMLSVSDDVSVDSGGGTLQMWRISDMITRSENDVLEEIASHR